MVLSESTPINSNKNCALVVDIAAMNSNDFSEFLQLNAEIEERRRQHLSEDASSSSGLLRATMTREEVFEVSSLDDDRFLTALEHQNSYVMPSRVQVTDLDLSSIENLMKYFDEEVPVTPTKTPDASKKFCSGKVASAIAKLALQSEPESSAKPKVNRCQLKISELKQKYEQQSEAALASAKESAKSSSISLPKKVKEMAHLFNSKISQVIRRSDEPQYVHLQNDLSLESKSHTQTELVTQSFREGPCLIAEDVFRELSVKDKALLFNQFISDMAMKHPKFTSHAEDLKAKVKKNIIRSEVAAEQEEHVEHLCQELEAKCDLGQPLPAVAETIVSPEGSETKADASPGKLHVSTLTVILKPSPEHEAAHPLPWRCLEPETSSQSREGCQKRNLGAIRCRLPTEAYAPPKKIRRTRKERTGTETQIFFQNKPLENLFYSWLTKENGVQFDITSVSDINETIEIADEKRFLEMPKTDQSTNSSGDVSQKSAVERLLEEAIAKLEKQNKVEEASQEIEAAPSQKQIQATPRRPKRRAPPVPVPQSSCQPQITCTMSSGSSSCKQSGTESESGLSTLPKITSDESRPDTPKDNIENAKPQRPPRKKKMRRTLTWKKENSIIEATANIVKSSDSDSDYNPKTAAPTKKKASFSSHTSVPEQSYIELDKSLMRQVNSPRKIRSAYTLTVMSSPSPNADSDQWRESESPRPSTSHSRRDSFVDQGFETCSNDPSDNSPIRRSVESSSLKPSWFSTPIKNRQTSTPVQQQLFSPNFATDRARRSSLAMQVIREDHPLDLDVVPNSPSTQSSEREFFANAPTIEMNSSQDEVSTKKAKSIFWISSGNFTVSMDIFHISDERLRLLYDIFTQKSLETREFTFGIDEHKFVRGGCSSDESMPERPQSIQGCSHYWFASGDLAVPFSGKIMSADKIKRLFAFLDSEQSELRFGVDHIDFSNLPEFWPTTQKYSIESSYSMLVGLQTGSSNGLEGRDKYAWPSSNDKANHTIKTSDLDQTELESTSFCNNSGRLSFSPDMFSLDYEPVPIDELFIKPSPEKPAPTMSMTRMMQILKEQQVKLRGVEQRIRCYGKPANLTDTSLEHCRDTPEYTQKLRSIIQAIDNIGRDNGFRSCSMEQLESFMYFLSEYADVCLANCSGHMDHILDTLLARRAVEV